jgi:hypothetical protein
MLRSPVFAYITGNSLLSGVSMTWNSVLVLVLIVLSGLARLRVCSEDLARQCGLR